MCAASPALQLFEEGQSSDLGRHPIQVAIQVSLLAIDNAFEPIMYAGRDGATGRNVRFPGRGNLLADRAPQWAN